MQAGHRGWKLLDQDANAGASAIRRIDSTKRRRWSGHTSTFKHIVASAAFDVVPALPLHDQHGPIEALNLLGSQYGCVEALSENFIAIPPEMGHQVKGLTAPAGLAWSRRETLDFVRRSSRLPAPANQVFNPSCRSSASLRSCSITPRAPR